MTTVLYKPAVLKFSAVMFAMMLLSPQANARDLLDGTQMSLWWIIPFLGVIGSLALCPIIIPKIWPAHYGKISLFWASLTLIAMINHYGVTPSMIIVMETMIKHFLPFVIMILVLYIVTGNIRIDLGMPATPLVNTLILTIGMILANIIGTTGASMLLIQPFISINRSRKYHQHSMVFFIFLVSNIGGCLTPLGDPPLFIGFLNGISSIWLINNMWKPLLMSAVPLVIIYCLIDSYLYKYKENGLSKLPVATKFFRIYGGKQFVFIAAIIVTIIINGVWQLDIAFDVIDQHPLLLKDIIRDLSLLLIAVVSYHVGHDKVRQQNNFSWHPLIEISKIFAAIFMTAVPVIAMLKSGADGALYSVIKSVKVDGYHCASAYFWLTGMLSAFLDNAPTYLIFFNISGGNAADLMRIMPSVLTAISAGAVFMGALSYIGNAPNFMVKSIAEQENIRMPGFFGYLMWSCGILLPIFTLLNIILF